MLKCFAYYVNGPIIRGIRNVLFQLNFFLQNENEFGFL